MDSSAQASVHSKATNLSHQKALGSTMKRISSLFFLAGCLLKGVVVDAFQTTGAAPRAVLNRRSLVNTSTASTTTTKLHLKITRVTLDGKEEPVDQPPKVNTAPTKITRVTSGGDEAESTEQRLASSSSEKKESTSPPVANSGGTATIPNEIFNLVKVSRP